MTNTEDTPKSSYMRRTYNYRSEQSATVEHTTQGTYLVDERCDGLVFLGYKHLHALVADHKVGG